MQFGMPTLIELQSIEACAKLCCELGLSFIELNMNMPEYQADMMNVSELRYFADKYKIYYTIHLDEKLAPCDFNDSVAAAYTETVLRTIEIAKQLHVPILNMHLNEGVYFTLPNEKVFLFDKYEDEYLHKLTAFRDACTTAIGDENIKITIENTNGYDSAAFLHKSLDVLLNSNIFALCFDIGHNAASDYTDEPIIIKRSDRLCHMHIHDAKGQANHLPFGEGDIDITKYLNLANEQNCRSVLEVKTVKGLRKSIEWIRSREK